MSSFTSVFKLAETRVVLCLAALLLLLESVFTLMGHQLSHDVENISQISATAKALQLAPPPRVLFVGNSLTQAGVDPALLKEEAVKNGTFPQLSIFTAYPDSSHATIWSFLLDRYFLEPGCVPENVVIITGRVHLLDAPPNHTALGAYYVSVRDIPYYLRHDARSIENAMDFLLGRCSSTITLRRRVSPRVFDALLPHYQENWYLLSHASMKGALVAGHQSNENVSTDHFQRLMAALKERGARLTIVAAPMPNRYEIHPSVLAATKENQIEVLDMNPVSGLTAEHFADADHLNARGKEIFTRALATELTNHWRKP
jgi:hypothetical protein